ncbi:putative DUF676 domain-containing protein [Seiridium cardinale]
MTASFSGRASLDIPSADSKGPFHGSWNDGHDDELDGRDPRASSTDSLVPSEYNAREKRKLLLVYIHGFMGNDNSFQKFPLHLHNHLRDQLRGTHAVHTKIYPRYKTYKAIEVARDNFSRWLEPHESATTDVVLLGHSMGGLLAAEVALMASPPTRDRHDVRFFQHRILGTVNLDAPLLGLHPGIVTSGLASLFRKKTEPPKSFEDPDRGDNNTSSRVPGLPAGQSPPAYPMFAPPPRATMDPNFDPAFPNDVRMKERGWWKNVVHFVTKHNSEGLMDAATNHFVSHMDFGSCLLDFNGLKQRYETLRRLEDIDDVQHHGMPHVPDRVRFVQYYTVCHGYPKKPKTPKPKEDTEKKEAPDYMLAGSKNRSEPSTPRISIEDHGEAVARRDKDQQLSTIDKDDALIEQQPSNVSSDSTSTVSSQPDSDHFHTPGASRPTTPILGESSSNQDVSSSAAPAAIESHADIIEETTLGVANPQKKAQSGRFKELLPEAPTFNIEEALQEFEKKLPALPEEPQKPEEVKSYDGSSKEIRKYVEKETKRRNKDYEKAMKSWRAAAESRKKAIKKMRGKLEAEQKAIRGKQAALSDAAANVGSEKVDGKEKEKPPSPVADESSEHQLVPDPREPPRSLRRPSVDSVRPIPADPPQNPGKDKGKAVPESPTKSGHRLSTDSLVSIPPVPIDTFTDDEDEEDKGKGEEITRKPVKSNRSSSPVPDSIQPTTSNDSGKSQSKKGGKGKERAKSPPKSPKPEKPDKPEKPAKPPKERKFCNRPSKVNGQVDPKWVKVFMKDVDEVAAHTGLFFPGPHYENLVGDVGDMIRTWTEDDATKRLFLGEG